MEREKNTSEWAKVNVQGRDIGGYGSKSVTEMGLCTRCAMMEYKRTRYGSASYQCCGGEHPKNLHPEDPIEDCSSFYPKGQMSLPQMFAMATPIEGSRRHKAGFVTDEELEENPELEWQLED